jgi:hypothetical protein
MGAVVKLQAVVDELDGLMEEITAYLNRRTGETYTLSEDDKRPLEKDLDPDQLPEWQRQAFPQMREVYESRDWLPLPTKFDIHEWSIMDDFSRSIDDPDLRGELIHAIRGRGAFRYFKDAICRRGIQDDWYRYRMAALEQIAMGLEEHGIAYEGGGRVSPSKQV